MPSGNTRPSYTTGNPNHRNILIVGDVGAGKSSVVNLIAGEGLAETSDGAAPSTLSSQEYIVTFDGVKFSLHDTAGMHEAKGSMKDKEYLQSVYQACMLISKLEQSGGISLLMFCVKGTRITSSVQETYSLFREVFCHHQVPVVTVVTHLEQYADMEQWWNKNEKHIKEYGLISDGHICITAARGYEGMHNQKYEESGQMVRKLLLEHSCRAWQEDRGTWIKRVLQYMGLLSKKPSGSKLRKLLTKRCGFSEEEAKLVAQKIEKSRRMPGDAPEAAKPRFREKSGTVGM